MGVATLPWGAIFISILISTTPMHLEPFVMHSALPARPQPLVRSLNLLKFDHISKKKYLSSFGVTWPSNLGCSTFGKQILPLTSSQPYSYYCCYCCRYAARCRTPWKCSTSWVLTPTVGVARWNQETRSVYHVRWSTPNHIRSSSSLATAGIRHIEDI